MNAVTSLEQRAVALLDDAPKPAPAAPFTFSGGDSGDIGGTAPDNALRVPSEWGQAGDIGDKPEPRARFELLDRPDGQRVPGVYWRGVIRDKEGNVTGQAVPVWVCSPLRVAAMTRDMQGSEWGRLLVFRDRDWREHRWTMPMRMLAGSGEELRGALLAEGLTITSFGRERTRLADYIQSERPEVIARCVTRTGWHGDVFVLPRETLGDTDAEPVLYQAASLEGVAMGQGGTLAGWREQVAARCAGNSRLVLAICAGFAGPCLGLMGAEGGGFHLRGGSSSGKTTALAVAASLYGPPGYRKEWRATDNALEGVAGLHSDLLLILDEIGQLDARHAGQVAYLLANGCGKARAAREGSPRAVASWRVLFLSGGEIGLSDLVTQSGGKVRAGQEVRVIDLPADAGAGLGVFEVIPNGMTGGAFADALKAASAKHYGHAAPAFLRALVADPAKARRTLADLRDGIAAELAGDDAAGQVRRVAQRFALVAAAGELATAWGLTGWATGEAQRAAASCFRSWLGARGTAGEAEPAAMLAQVRAFLSAHGESRFTDWDAGEHAPRTINRAGYRSSSSEGPMYYVEAEAFKREVAQCFDPKAMAQLRDAKNPPRGGFFCN